MKLLPILIEHLFNKLLPEDGSEPEVISKEDAYNKIMNAKSDFFTVEFFKKDGTLRVMNCRRGIKKHLKGGQLAYDPVAKGLIPVYDMKISNGPEGYRMINKDTIVALKIGGKTYKVE